MLEKRLNVQKFNNKCEYDSGYILGSLEDGYVKSRIYDEIKRWIETENMDGVDVVIATPPCQGMSVANHKKKNEIGRNSLVVQSIAVINHIKPKVAIFENVRTFLKTLCVDSDGKTKTIHDAILNNMTNYNIYSDIINFKDYGNPSQRTRTLVICTRKDLTNISPLELMPTMQAEKTVRQTIGGLPLLKNMGSIDPEDIFHFFRKYDTRMIPWIKDLQEGESAFNNKETEKLPHTIKNNQVCINQNKNKDKYTRCFWDRPMPCIHTRNDILASQMTIHPSDNRVFSIRELMMLMGIPRDFNWTAVSENELNNLELEAKKQFLKKEELNIRKCIGEAVPTVIFDRIAQSVKLSIGNQRLKTAEVLKIIKTNRLNTFSNLKSFVQQNLNVYDHDTLSKIIELSNAERTKNSAYYTAKGVCFSLVESLPKFDERKHVHILEPSAGAGNFLPLLISKYGHCEKVTLDVMDIDKKAIELLRILERKMSIPTNISLNYIHSDFLTHDLKDRYDIIVGNPPFKKIVNNTDLLARYKERKFNTYTNNVFSFFIENAIRHGDHVAFVVPKSLLSAPEFNKTREQMNRYNLVKIVDFGEKAFDIKIETIGFVLKRTEQKPDNRVRVESLVTNQNRSVSQSYITSSEFPYWLIYRDDFFDEIKKKMKFNIFTVFRDRQITSKILSDSGPYRVLKSRNVGSNEIRSIRGYDTYISKKQLEPLAVKKYLNTGDCVLIPNLTYLPRACFMPDSCICDGSVAIARAKSGTTVNEKTLEYYSTDEFRQFYRIARNRSTRSMNIDSNSIYFFGKLK